MPSNTRWFALVLLATSSVFLFFHFPIKNGDGQTSHVAPIPSKLEIMIAPGVGFDLSLDYCTIAISHTNGSVFPIARIETTSSFREAWRRMSLNESRHAAPPYHDLNAEFYDRPRQWLRRTLKAIGLPASKDVRMIANMLAVLRDKTEEVLGRNIDSLLVTTPHLYALYNEDIRDALEYLRLPVFQTTYSLENFPYCTTGALAGTGQGLCQEYRRPRRCYRELLARDNKWILTVVYTRNGFMATKAMAFDAHTMAEVPRPVHTDLGSAMLDSADDQMKIKYWERMHVELSKCWSRYPASVQPDDVLVLGESAQDARFLRKLREFLDAEGFSNCTIHAEDPLYLAAKGAAELARRARFTEKMWHLRLNETGDDDTVEQPVLVEQSEKLH